MWYGKGQITTGMEVYISFMLWSHVPPVIGSADVTELPLPIVKKLYWEDSKNKEKKKNGKLGANIFHQYERTRLITFAIHSAAPSIFRIWNPRLLYKLLADRGQQRDKTTTMSYCSILLHRENQDLGSQVSFTANMAITSLCVFFFYKVRNTKTKQKTNTHKKHKLNQKFYKNSHSPIPHSSNVEKSLFHRQSHIFVICWVWMGLWTQCKGVLPQSSYSWPRA